MTHMKEENSEFNKSKWQQWKWHKIEALPYIFFIHHWMILGLHVLVKTKKLAVLTTEQYDGLHLLQHQYRIP